MYDCGCSVQRTTDGGEQRSNVWRRGLNEYEFGMHAVEVEAGHIWHLFDKHVHDTPKFIFHCSVIKGLYFPYNERNMQDKTAGSSNEHCTGWEKHIHSLVMYNTLVTFRLYTYIRGCSARWPCKFHGIFGVYCRIIWQTNCYLFVCRNNQTHINYISWCILYVSAISFTLVCKWLLLPIDSQNWLNKKKCICNHIP